MSTKPRVMPREQLEKSPPSALSREPSAFAVGLLVGMTVVVLGMIWWPLMILAGVVVFFVYCHLCWVKTAVDHWAAVDAARNINRGPSYDDTDVF